MDEARERQAHARIMAGMATIERAIRKGVGARYARLGERPPQVSIVWNRGRPVEIFAIPDALNLDASTDRCRWSTNWARETVEGSWDEVEASVGVALVAACVSTLAT